MKDLLIVSLSIWELGFNVNYMDTQYIVVGWQGEMLRCLDRKPNITEPVIY